jgi:hypothetical protein
MTDVSIVVILSPAFSRCPAQRPVLQWIDHAVIDLHKSIGRVDLATALQGIACYCTVAMMIH